MTNKNNDVLVVVSTTAQGVKELKKQAKKEGMSLEEYTLLRLCIGQLKEVLLERSIATCLVSSAILELKGRK